jgi:hypothetical protein
MQTRQRATLRTGIGLLTALAASAAMAAVTATFTEGDRGTFPGVVKLDRRSQVLTVDLSGLPKGATVFRAELMLERRGRFRKAPTKPTRVFPLGRPDAKLPFVASRFASLDALEAVRAAVKAGRPLRLKLETTLAGVERLEVSYLEGKATRNLPTVGEVKVIHCAGQSLVVFREPQLGGFGEFKTGADVAALKERLLKKHPHVRFRIWRSAERITAAGMAKAKLVGECGLMTAWNDSYHQDSTQREPPLRYRVTDAGKPVEWGTGIYAHNPDRAGRAFYAVTVAEDGQEDFDSLGPQNTTSQPIEETVGQGEPVLQWVERIDRDQRWHYRHGELVRLIYTRWEAWPHASRPSVPIDYLVVIPLTPRPSGEVREPQYRSFRVEPAPVGLHLHAWGGSLNSGYGWWYNGHRGAVLIASNQVPYDWWTGYHEANETRKTYGDGHVRPFTMDRVLGFLDWAGRQHRDAPEVVRKYWPALDRTRVFTAGNSMGGSGAPMYAVRYGGRIAWALGWVGVHVPALSPQFKNSYQLCYGPRDAGITMPDGRTSPWDHFSDVWWLRKHVAEDTGLIIASNGKNDGGIGWEQAWQFARALQETRRPHFFNWDVMGHGSHTRIGANFDLDVRTDQSLPAFTHCSLDDDLGTAKRKSDEQIAAERERQKAEVAAGKRRQVHVDPYDGVAKGQLNGYLWWRTDGVVDTKRAWEMTVLLKPDAPKGTCTVDLTPRRLQQLKPRPGERFTWTNSSDGEGREIASGEVTADKWGLVTLQRLTVGKAGSRITIRRK